MKFTKGLLDEAEEKPRTVEENSRSGVPVVEKDRLFQTLEETKSSGKKYLTLLGIFGIVVIISGAAFFYFTLPKSGDVVRAPQGLEAAVRDHLLVSEKRTATDITFYYCETFYWARVGVEKRPDIKTNPLYLIDTYKARAIVREDGAWTVAAAPITSSEMDAPCK